MTCIYAFFNYWQKNGITHVLWLFYFLNTLYVNYITFFFWVSSPLQLSNFISFQFQTDPYHEAGYSYQQLVLTVAPIHMFPQKKQRFSCLISAKKYLNEQ